MIKFSCRDLGFKCDFTITSEHREEVIQAAILHANTEHAEITCKYTKDQSREYLENLEAAIQPAD